MEKGTSSRPPSGPSYEVFLNFRGADTRHTFTDFLYRDMVGAGIIVFRDNESLHVGEKIGSELLQAIENSQIYIPIFSKHYASSCWCLRELAHIVECTSKSNGNKEILPIFLGVKPANVKLMTNLYTRDFSECQKISSSNEVESWKKALVEVAKIKGWTWKKDESFSEEGIGWIKAARKLKVLNLSYCNNLTRTPDLPSLVSLEILDLEGCTELVEIDPSIGELKHLTTLNLRDCCSLQELPDRIGCLQTSTKVAMPPMPHEFEFQQISSNLKSSLTLDLSGTQISKLPHSIGGMVKITVLRLCGCRNIEDLPDWIWNLESLIELDLSRTGISHLSDSIGNLKQLAVLRMRGIWGITILPSTIWLLEKLEVLDANGCEKLTGEIPEDIERLSRLRILDLLRTQISGLAITVSRLSNLQELKLGGCYALRHLPDLHPSLTRLTWGRAWPRSVYDLYTSISALDSPSSISNPNQLKLQRLHAMTVRFLPRLPSSLCELRLEDVVTTQSPDFSNLINLSTLDFQRCSMQEFSGIFDAELKELKMCSCIFIRLDALFQLEMKRLTSLSLIRCEFRPEIVDLSHMKNLQVVRLVDCKLLVEIRVREELGSLSSLTVWGCSSIERMSDLSKLRKLHELKVGDCPKLRSVEGLNHLESLGQLWIRDCESMESLADTSNLDLFCLKIVGCKQLPDHPNYCKRRGYCDCRNFVSSIDLTG